MNYLALLLSDARGIYIPRDFITGFDLRAWHVPCSCVRPILKQREWLWDAWQDVLNTAYFIDKDNRRWTLYQDGDLWAVADDMPEQQRREFFGEC